MYDLHIILGLLAVLIEGVFIIWFVSKLTNKVKK